jgi:DNA polymerase-1
MNFLIVYGGDANTLSRKLDIPRAQSQVMYSGYRRSLPVLFGWIASHQAFARKHGYVNTYFGRRRWLKQFYSRPEPGMQAFADRSATNTTSPSRSRSTTTSPSASGTSCSSSPYPSSKRRWPST